MSALSNEGGSLAVGSSPSPVDGTLFRHSFEPPSGRRSVPLMSILDPLVRWTFHPCAPDPFEILTLHQIVDRSLGSAHESQRRTLLVLPDPISVRDTFAALVDRLVHQARAELGATVLPIALSLKRLLEHPAELAEFAKAIPGEPSTPEEVSLQVCEWLLAKASPTDLSPEVIGELVHELRYGNAWLLVEDDAHAKAQLSAVKRLFEAALASGEMSHVPVLMVTTDPDHQIVKAMRMYRLERALGAPPASSRPLRLRSTRWLRLTSAGNTPPAPITIALGAAGAAAILWLLYVCYERVFGHEGSWMGEAGAIAVASLVVPLLLAVWGIFYGSEEIRRAIEETILVAFLASVSSFLLFIPRAISPGPWRVFGMLALGIIPSFLWALVSLSLLSVCVTIAWVRASHRLLRRLDPEKLVDLAGRFEMTLFPAYRGACLVVGNRSAPKLPLLVSKSSQGIVPVLLESFPSMVKAVNQLIIEGLKEQSGRPAYAASALLISALIESPQRYGQARRCLRALAADLARLWESRHDFGEFHGDPSTQFKMNALEYAARQIAYLCDIDDLTISR